VGRGDVSPFEDETSMQERVECTYFQDTCNGEGCMGCKPCIYWNGAV